MTRWNAGLQSRGEVIKRTFFCKKIKKRACKVPVLWYIISLLRLSRARHRADIYNAFCGSSVFKAGFPGLKKSKKFRKTICKVKKVWYIMFLLRVLNGTDATGLINTKTFLRIVSNEFSVWKNRKKFKKRFAKLKKCDILSLCHSPLVSELIENWIVRCKPWKFTRDEINFES